jgi:hypothetical protein
VKDYYKKQCWDWQFKNWPYCNYDMWTFDEAIKLGIDVKSKYNLPPIPDLYIIRKSIKGKSIKISQIMPLKEAVRIQKLNNL